MMLGRCCAVVENQKTVVYARLFAGKFLASWRKNGRLSNIKLI